jgi:hypothetical protein
MHAVQAGQEQRALLNCESQLGYRVRHDRIPVKEEMPL